jgi:5-methylcytosine-specific restriction endonuclease McrA
MKIPDNLIIPVLKRDGWVCIYCGERSNLSVKVIKPNKEITLENLHTVCEPCHKKYDII